MSAVATSLPEATREETHFKLHRRGRFIIAELEGSHIVLSTSVRNGGQSDTVRFLMNHQSCEAAAHLERHDVIHAAGLNAYHDRACSEAGLDPEIVALMGTAANMNCASVVRCHSDGLDVTAVVTAGVGGNAECAADPTVWSEGPDGFRKVMPYAGTINTMVLVNRPVAPNALAQAAMAITEAKATALQRLAVRSRYSRELATGTNTDQYCIASYLEKGPRITSTSTGVRAGELIARAVRDATLEALRWQNGLEPSYARSVFHALGVYGVREETFLEDMRPLLKPAAWELLKANSKAVIYEPLLAAAAFAMATTLDRYRHAILPMAAAREALRQQAASMACALAAQPSRWNQFHGDLIDVDVESPAHLVLKAMAMGWSAKWI